MAGIAIGKLCNINSKVGCHIDDKCINHAIYAEDICLTAPSLGELQTD